MSQWKVEVLNCAENNIYFTLISFFRIIRNKVCFRCNLKFKSLKPQLSGVCRIFASDIKVQSFPVEQAVRIILVAKKLDFQMGKQG